MSRHPSDESLWTHLDPALEPDDEVVRHLEAGCPRCEVRLTDYRAMRRLLDTPPLPPVPEAWARAARKALQARLEVDARSRSGPVTGSEAPPSLGDRVRDTVRTLQAALTLDTIDPGALAGIRSAGAGPRTLLFECDAGEVYLQLHPRGERIEVRGQAMLADDLPLEEGRVILERDGRAVRRKLDAAGAFVLPLLDRGRPVSLRLSLPALEVVLDPFDP